jgi:putative ABC transport system substrate-binding protein
MSEVHAAGHTLGIDTLALEIRRAEDIAPAFDVIKARADALYVVLDPIMNAHRVRISILSVGARLPTMVPFRAFVEAGGLISYAPNQSQVFRRGADYVDKILRGTKPGDIPVEQPGKFDLVINLTTAKALGVTIQESFLLRADEVIE